MKTKLKIINIKVDISLSLFNINIIYFNLQFCWNKFKILLLCIQKLIYFLL